jgi:hypothetical protein
MLERECASLRLDLRLAKLGLTSSAERSRHGSMPGRWSLDLALRPKPSSRDAHRRTVVLPQSLAANGWTLR